MGNINTIVSAAEKAAYQKGYKAGRVHVEAAEKRAARDRAEAKHRQAFRERAFLAVLDFAMNQSTWCVGPKGGIKTPINTIAERVGLAWDVADEAMKRR